jgi:hypothetical protein
MCFGEKILQRSFAAELCCGAVFSNPKTLCVQVDKLESVCQLCVAKQRKQRNKSTENKKLVVKKKQIFLLIYIKTKIQFLLYFDINLIMLNFFRLIFAIVVIVLIVPQTPSENIVLRALHSKRILENYGAEKRFLIYLTWFCLLTFLALCFITSIN